MKELSIPKELKEVQGCVYRIWYNRMYVVVMANQLEWSLKSIQSDLNRFKKGVREGKSEGNLYLKFYQYIINHPDQDFFIEVVIKSDSKYELLKHTQIELANGERESWCLNSKYSPYINKNIQHNKVEKEKRGRVSRGTVLNFLKWRKKTYPTRFLDL